eukprot:m.113921 g.113921  ORF g.113921 m.113921 type:complete len:708 (-) comp9144_c0_seq5:854-2977(-)
MDELLRQHVSINGGTIKSSQHVQGFLDAMKAESNLFNKTTYLKVLEITQRKAPELVQEFLQKGGAAALETWIRSDDSPPDALIESVLTVLVNMVIPLEILDKVSLAKELKKYKKSKNSTIASLADKIFAGWVMAAAARIQADGGSLPVAAPKHAAPAAPVSKPAPLVAPVSKPVVPVAPPPKPAAPAAPKPLVSPKQTVPPLAPSQPIVDKRPRIPSSEETAKRPRLETKPVPKAPEHTVVASSAFSSAVADTGRRKRVAVPNPNRASTTLATPPAPASSTSTQPSSAGSPDGDAARKTPRNYELPKTVMIEEPPRRRTPAEAAPEAAMDVDEPAAEPVEVAEPAMSKKKKSVRWASVMEHIKYFEKDTENTAPVHTDGQGFAAKEHKDHLLERQLRERLNEQHRLTVQCQWAAPALLDPSKPEPTMNAAPYTPAQVPRMTPIEPPPGEDYAPVSQEHFGLPHLIPSVNVDVPARDTDTYKDLGAILHALRNVSLPPRLRRDPAPEPRRYPDMPPVRPPLNEYRPMPGPDRVPYDPMERPAPPPVHGGPYRDPYMDRPPYMDRDRPQFASPFDEPYEGGGYDRGRPLYDRPPHDRPPFDRPPYDRPPYDRPPYDRPPYDRPYDDRGPYSDPYHDYPAGPGGPGGWPRDGPPPPRGPGGPRGPPPDIRGRPPPPSGPGAGAPGPRRLCRFFGTAGGCRNGATCQYSHG